MLTYYQENTKANSRPLHGGCSSSKAMKALNSILCCVEWRTLQDNLFIAGKIPSGD
jgi:hypothetical protein